MSAGKAEAGDRADYSIDATIRASVNKAVAEKHAFEEAEMKHLLTLWRPEWGEPVAYFDPENCFLGLGVPAKIGDTAGVYLPVRTRFVIRAFNGLEAT